MAGGSLQPQAMQSNDPFGIMGGGQPGFGNNPFGGGFGGGFNPFSFFEALLGGGQSGWGALPSPEVSNGPRRQRNAWGHPQAEHSNDPMRRRNPWGNPKATTGGIKKKPMGMG